MSFLANIMTHEIEIEINSGKANTIWYFSDYIIAKQEN